VSFDLAATIPRKPVEETVVVERTWRRLGVELDAHHRQRAVGETLDRPVVQVTNATSQPAPVGTLPASTW
jgi:hypothetical protein